MLKKAEQQPLVRHSSSRYRSSRGAPGKKRALLAIVILALLIGSVYLRFGGGKDYPDLTLPSGVMPPLEEVLAYPEPLGNVAVSATGRVFFTVHPESRPSGNKLLVRETDGRIHAFPSEAAQAELFDAVMGLVIDARGMLWTIDHGQHGFRQPRLLGFDIKTGKVLKDFALNAEVAPKGSFLQDLQVNSSGTTAYIADVSFLRNSPGIVVVDLKTGNAWRALDQDPSVMPQSWLIRNPTKTMSWLGGLFTLKPGIDGIAISKNDQFLVYGAMAHDTLFSVPTAALTRAEAGQAALQVKALGRKPLNDGLSMDRNDNIFITDVEHGSVMKMTPAGLLSTVVQDVKRLRWADALSFGPDGWLYVADSAIPDQMLRSKSHMREQAPYRIFRFKPGTEGVPGQ
ncbi:MAG: L-dopachrome tautomerase-related protein [Pseudomonadota bacterium]